jgi:ABC-type sugar transport system ATPase subunit
MANSAAPSVFVGNLALPPCPHGRLGPKGAGKTILLQLVRRGQQRRPAVAVAFAGSPDLVLLDEPTTGLDVEARYAL